MIDRPRRKAETELVALCLGLTTHIRVVKLLRKRQKPKLRRQETYSLFPRRDPAGRPAGSNRDRESKTELSKEREREEKKLSLISPPPRQEGILMMMEEIEIARRCRKGEKKLERD